MIITFKAPIQRNDQQTTDRKQFIEIHYQRIIDFWFYGTVENRAYKQYQVKIKIQLY